MTFNEWWPKDRTVLVSGRSDRGLRDVAEAAWNEQQTRIDELEAAFDMLHSHADDMIDIGGINILTISDVIMDKRGRAMRMRHTKIT